MGVQYFKDYFLTEKVNLAGSNLKGIHAKTRPDADYAQFKAFISQDPGTKLSEDDTDTIEKAGEYTIWFLYNPMVSVPDPKNSKSWIPYNSFISSAVIDPTTMFFDGVGQKIVKKMGVYTKWILAQWSKSVGGARLRFAEDLEGLTDAFAILRKHSKDVQPTELVKNPKDINSFKTVRILLDYTREYRDMVGASDEQKLAKESVVLYKGSYDSRDLDGEAMTKLTIAIPLTHYAAQQYGENTDWCTARESDLNYNNYSKDGELFCVLFENPETEMEDKFQFHFESQQYMDCYDSPIDLDAFMLNHPLVKKTLLNYFLTNFDKKPVYLNNILTIDDSGETLVHLLETGRVTDTSVVKPKHVAKIMNMRDLKDKSFLDGYKNKEGLIVKDGTMYVVYKHWKDADLLELFDQSSSDEAGNALSDEADYYEEEDTDMDNIWWDMSRENRKLILDRLTSLGLEVDGEPVTMRNVDDFQVTDLLQEYEAERLHDNIKDLYNTAVSDSRENSTREAFERALESTLGDSKWISDPAFLVYDSEFRTNYGTGKRERQGLDDNLGFAMRPSNLIDHYNNMLQVLDEGDDMPDLHDVITKSLTHERDLVSVSTQNISLRIDIKQFNIDLTHMLAEMGEFTPVLGNDIEDESSDDDDDDDVDMSDDEDEDEGEWRSVGESFKNLKSFHDFK